MRHTREGGTSGCAVCHTIRGDVRILVCVKENVDLSIPFAFLDQLANLLENYCGSPLTETRVKDCFDVVYELFEEVLHGGIPLTTEFSTVKDLVAPPSLMSKVLTAANVPGLPPLASSSPSSNIFSSPIPWRRLGIRYSQNEIFVDIVERLQGILDRNGNFVTGSITGKVNTNSKLSGMPDLLLAFAEPSVLQDVAFHSCVRYQKWAKERLVSFVPPDGKFTLLTYRYGSPGFLNAFPIGNTGMLPHGSGIFPLRINSQITTGSAGGSFNITIASRLSPSQEIEDTEITFFLGEEADGVAATISAGGGGMAFRDSRSSNGKKAIPRGGRWEFDPTTHVLTWSIPSLSAAERPPSLKGTWESSSTLSTPASSFTVKSFIPFQAISNIKVQALKLTNEGYNVYKGLKYNSELQLDIRW
ncbi:hypothetical protein BT69DRAFT_1050050 [Atractiella rhizophila]|nr:hypothetical protein BT69DRAFT_1050050 [Atractiella rhizophila]